MSGAKPKRPRPPTVAPYKEAHFWTLERTRVGLRRAAAELFNNDPARLPRSHDAYGEATRAFDHCVPTGQRLYPPSVRILQHWPSLTAAWHSLGLLDESKVWKMGNPYWTRQRCLEAGAAYYRKFGAAPTNDDWWHKMTRYMPRTDTPGAVNEYPSYMTMKRIGGWVGMREFWREVSESYPELKIEIDAGDMPWSPLEEWFIVESVGILPRDEVVKLMCESGLGRTAPAIKRRLYELGVNTYNRWGWTINKIQEVTGVSYATVLKYVAAGRIPFMPGSRCIYVDPGDLPVIEEYDWSKAVHPEELERAVRASLMLRLGYALQKIDRRPLTPHRIQPLPAIGVFGRKRIGTPPRLPDSPRPAHIAHNDFARIKGEWRFKTPGALVRIGQVRAVFWSPQRRRATQKSPAREACWMVALELRKLKAHGNSYPRTRYNIPAAAVERVPEDDGVVNLPVKEPAVKRDRSRRRERMQRVGLVAAKLVGTHQALTAFEEPLRGSRKVKKRAV